MEPLAMLVGGLLGIVVRRGVDPPLGANIRRSRSFSTSALGGFALGLLTGVALGVRRLNIEVSVVSGGLSAALFTYCLFSSASIALVRHQGGRNAIVIAAAAALIGFAAATGGVVTGLELLR